MTDHDIQDWSFNCEVMATQHVSIVANDFPPSFFKAPVERGLLGHDVAVRPGLFAREKRGFQHRPKPNKPTDRSRPGCKYPHQVGMFYHISTGMRSYLIIVWYHVGVSISSWGYPSSSSISWWDFGITKTIHIVGVSPWLCKAPYYMILYVDVWYNADT